MEFRGEARYEGTDWTRHNVASIWALLERQRTDNHWRRVSAWRKTYELTSAHLSHLLVYRDQLAAVWPPEKNPAAAAYLSRLDQLITHVRQTYDVATANYTTLAAAIGALDTARSKIKKIHDEYAAKQEVIQKYEHAIAELPEDSIGRLKAKPPYCEAEMEQLNVRARSVMFDLSRTLIEAKAQIKTPPQANLGTKVSPDNPDLSDNPPPVIPPVVAIPAPAESATVTARQPGPSISPAPSAGAGPVLGGTSPVTTPTPATPGSPSLVPSAPAPGVIGPPAVPPIPGLATPLGPGASGKPAVGTVPRAMPPGGIIGGPPAVNFGQAPATPVRRINPVGGVVNSQPAGGMLPTQHGQPTGSGIRRQHDKGSRQWDSDNPWETDKGVDPVVRPPQHEGRFDAGTVIGISR